MKRLLWSAYTEARVTRRRANLMLRKWRACGDDPNFRVCDYLDELVYSSTLLAVADEAEQVWLRSREVGRMTIRDLEARYSEREAAA